MAKDVRAAFVRAIDGAETLPALKGGGQQYLSMSRTRLSCKYRGELVEVDALDPKDKAEVRLKHSQMYGDEHPTRSSVVAEEALAERGENAEDAQHPAS